MMFLKVLYYHYYLFYTRVLPDPEPHATSVFTLSMSESFFVVMLIDFIGAKYYCTRFLEVWSMVAITAAIIVANYLLFMKNKQGVKIVKDKPLLFNSVFISRFITILFFLFTTSLLFWPPFVIRDLIENCK